ncbi:MAG: hypothetical protein PUE01_02120 [Clostridiaceae bacterium]|nr:hypothetical protein [Clostridiaceae bacterium]
MSSYSSKVSALTEKKHKEDEDKRVAEAKAAEIRKQEEEKQKQQQEQSRQAQNTSNQNNKVQEKGETVYIAASGKGNCYHNDPNCSKMNGNVNSMSRNDAENQGYRACKKCYR